ncbi:MAG TPA: ComF family protein [Candidatus Faecousia intestinigallinarum]|nr:ComF family protein [Candidatus Faecousia intestinigallinarum]
MKKAAAWIWELLFPSKCVLCGKILDAEGQDLCRRCREETFDHHSGRKSISFVASWRALWYYEGAVRKSLLRYKFQNARSYAGSYGRLLAMRLLSEGLEFDVLTWVPVSSRRRLRRGYDQVALLAQALGEELEIQPVQTLKKIRHNPPQSGIHGQAERRANVLGVYRAVQPERFAGKRVLLVDDIITTGATVSECARELRSAGAAEVYCAAVAAARQE